MRTLRKLLRFVSPALIAVLLFATAPIVPATAGIVSTDRLIDVEAAAQDRDRVASFLAREDVRQQMIEMGVDPADVERRVSSMSDSEIRVMASKIDEMPAGQGAVGLVILVAVVLFVVFIITDMVGATDVFPFVNSSSERK